MLRFCIFSNMNTTEEEATATAQKNNAGAATMLRRPYGRRYSNSNLLLRDVSIVGLGCSSFSTFFWRDSNGHDENDKSDAASSFTVESLNHRHPIVQEWVATIHEAIASGITLLDTAPWYGHGVSEVVVGWALCELAPNVRATLTINTKVGRYEADLAQQFDFGRETTLQSVERSLRRLQTSYIDVLQLHDPEFAPNLEILLDETIPAMIYCQQRGQCRALGLTGYPLAVQHQILQSTRERLGRPIFDQVLTYTHYTMHDMSLLSHPLFTRACPTQKLVCLAAAPLSMGLLTPRGPMSWHPASVALRKASQRAVTYCQEHQVDIVELAMLVALTEPGIACTIVGMKDREQLRYSMAVVARVRQAVAAAATNESETALTTNALLDHVLTAAEKQAWQHLRDREHGPFAAVWITGDGSWDGVNEAHNFWKQLPNVQVQEWQARD